MNQDRKDLKRIYKETPTRRGIFRVHDTKSGRSWVDASPNVDTIRNRIWFTLGMGTHRNAALQQAWNDAGADAMVFEIMEVFPDDASKFEVDDLMKTRKAHWITELGAEAIQ